MEQENQSSWGVTVLRWIAFLPSALLAAWLAWFLVALLNRVTMRMQGIDPGSFFFRGFIEYISHAVMGAAFVYTGAKIVPSHKKVVAYILAAIGLVLAVFLLFPSIMAADYWAIWSDFSLIFGVGVTAYSVSIGETKL